MIPLEAVLIFSSALFCIGLYGVFTLTNGVRILMCIEIMLNAGNINLVAFSAYNGDPNGGVFALFTISVAAAEVAIGLAILYALFTKQGTIDVDRLRILRW